MNRASGGHRTVDEPFKILKDDANKVLHSVCQQTWKTQQWSQDWKRSVFIPITKKGNAKECSNYHPIVLISHANKVMVQIHQARLQQYMNWGFPDVQTGFTKGRGTRNQIANICWIMEKAREFQKKKKSTSASLTMLKPLTVWITISCGKFLKRWEYQTTYLRNLYAGQETIVRTRHGTMDLFKIGKGVCQPIYCHPAYLTSAQSISCEMQG